MGYKFNPFTGNLDNTGNPAFTIPEYDNADKPSPVAGDIWIKHTTPTGGGSPIGLLLALTYSGSGIEKYELSVHTLASTTKRVELI